MLIMLVLSLCLRFGGSPQSPQTINMISIINMSLVLATFSKKRMNMVNIINISPGLSIFRETYA